MRRNGRGERNIWNERRIKKNNGIREMRKRVQKEKDVGCRDEWIQECEMSGREKGEG